MSSNESLSRRTVLQRAWQVAALGIGAGITGAALEGCGPEHNTTPTTTTSTTPSLRTATTTDWNRLGSSLSGQLIVPTSASYGIDRLLYNSKFTNLHPQGIAYCATEDDVARCVDFISTFDVDVAARSGGHSYGGYSNSDGLVIDVSKMSSVSVNTSTNIATVGAGAMLIDVYNEIGSKNRLLPAGSCPTVGIAGLAMGGGQGVFSRKYGMTSDNIQSARVVTPGGNKLHASDNKHSDLLWALKGGGGGNFGVVTSLEFTVHPMPEVTLFSLQYPWAAAADMLQAWQQWISTAPDELWSNCQVQSDGTYGYLAELGGVFCGSPAELNSLLSTLQSSIGTNPTYNFVGSKDYLDAMEIEAGCSGLTIAACHLTTQNPSGTLSRSAYSAKSSFVNRPMDQEQAANIVNAIEQLHGLVPTLGGALAFDSQGGIIDAIGPTDTAYFHRGKLACIQASYSWSTYTSQADINLGEGWLQYLQTNVFDPSTGAYQNYIDPTLASWEQSYYGQNLPRLKTIKSKYDSENRFSFAQSIPLAT